MKLSTSALPRFFREGISSCKTLLFYGEEPAFVQVQLEKLRGHLSLPIQRIQPQDIIKGTIFLSDLLSAQDFFSPAAHVMLADVPERITTPMQEWLNDAPTTDQLVILTSSYLGPRSKLRKLFETHTSAVSIGCFPPTFQEIEAQLQAAFSAVSVTITSDANALIVRHFLGQPHRLENDVRQLCAYVYPKKTIDIADVHASLSLGAQNREDDLVTLILKRDIVALKKALLAVETSSLNPIGSLRMLSATFLRLQELKERVSAGGSLEKVAFLVSPPIIPFQLKLWRPYLNSWSRDNLARAVAIFLSTEQACKENYTLQNDLWMRGVLSSLKKGPVVNS